MPVIVACCSGPIAIQGLYVVLVKPCNMINTAGGVQDHSSGARKSQRNGRGSIRVAGSREGAGVVIGKETWAYHREMEVQSGRRKSRVRSKAVDSSILSDVQVALDADNYAILQ